MTIIFGTSQREIPDLIANQVAPSLPFHQADFCTKVRDLPDGVSTLLTKTFDRLFFWHPDRYSAKLSMTVDGTEAEKLLTFEVTQPQSSGLKGVRLKLRNCEGIGMPLMLPDLDTIFTDTNSVRVSLEPK
jgi:hypothetical protein